jgi:hypothetical protein
MNTPTRRASVVNEEHRTIITQEADTNTATGNEWISWRVEQVGDQRQVIRRSGTQLRV